MELTDRTIRGPESDWLDARAVGDIVGFEPRTVEQMARDGRFPKGTPFGRGIKRWFWLDVMCWMWLRSKSWPPSEEEEENEE